MYSISCCHVYKEAKFKVLIFFKKTVFLFTLVSNSKKGSLKIAD